MVYTKNYLLLKRQKLLLALLEAFGRSLSNLDLQKYLFLYTTRHQDVKSYEFIPYKYGCFSFQTYADRRRLIELGLIEDCERWVLTDHHNPIKALDKIEQKNLALFLNRYKGLCGNKLVHYIYKNYPYYAINSKIAHDIMQEDELLLIEQARPRQEDFCFFTIGYEGKPFEHYLNRLIQNNVRMVCDVRKNPISRKYGFSKATLSKGLTSLNIQYIHIPELGIFSEDRQDLNTQEEYDCLFDTYEHSIILKQQPALDQLKVMVDRYKRVAITCFEADHLRCHRNRVAKVLANRSDWNYTIKHI
ncbi:hypothetical protein COMNV_01174 [Commensalibacter sp. Nvir]|uniref:DUF488 domain-containing protein n=1 Tax=Commensalibacter sp. Nvir TaxID=3069817 RepID=UPI002D342C46|nr:hypothetical protein COMNV_01174 [Commensalibacter sp. Nvir]